jgi:serine protease AprX
MPSSNQTPIDRHPAPFDRRVLRRSVIAIPLREAIEEELAQTKELKARYGARFKAHHNTAVFYRREAHDSSDDRYKIVKERLTQALEELGEKRDVWIDPPEDGVSPPGSLARLDGKVIRLLLAFDENSANPVIDRIWPTRFDVIIDVNLYFQRPDAARTDTAADVRDVRALAKDWIKEYIDEAKRDLGIDDPDQGVDIEKTAFSKQYVFAMLEGMVIERLVALDQRKATEWAEKELALVEDRIRETLGEQEVKKRVTKPSDEIAKLAGRFRAIHHIWPDFRLRGCVTRSIATVKVDAAHRSFTALGQEITWAVADSGIEATHPHFSLHKNIDPASPYHADFTGLSKAGSALKDLYGHGTHVAGIIAGEQSTEKKSSPANMVAMWRELNESGSHLKSMQLDAVSGMAPKCQLVSLKVLDRFGQGAASNVITAIAHIQAINHNGRELHIHGLNLSLGYPFDPKWFACGHSPLCVEVNRLVKSGVVVVIAAGNTGYGTLMTKEGQSDASLDLTINDPGNAEYAITVGSTHREMPHMYGVSYFSSKGPTGDGRYKPDLLAPGEKIISCAAPNSRLVEDETDNTPCAYFETSGTSMAAPHVSGSIAAFLSIRREFIGEPEKVKKIFTSTATDLGRDRYFQGSGLVDLMRAIQSV